MNKSFKINGEDVICNPVPLCSGDLMEARNAAQEISGSENHHWAYVWHINEEGSRLVCEVYSRGKLMSIDEVFGRVFG